MMLSDEFRPQVIGLLKRVFPFRYLEDDDLAWIADAGEVIEFEPGEDLYEQGAPAEFFHIIMDGDVNLSYNTGDSELSMGVLEDTDFFGFEVIDPRPIYRTSAFAVSEGRLFRLHRETVKALMHDLPFVSLPLRMQAHSLHLSLTIHLPWRAQEESIIYIDRRHPYFLIKRLFFPVIFFFAALTFAVYFALAAMQGTFLFGLGASAATFLTGFWVLWNYVDWTNDYSIITNHRVVFQEKVILFYDSRQEVPLEAVLATSMETSQFGRLVGFGDMIMKTYTGRLAFPDLRHPEVVSEILEDQRSHLQHLHEMEEKRTLRKLIRRRLQFTQEEQSAGKQVPRQLKPGSLSEILANIFQMRWEMDGVVTYRKHWFILLRKIMLPAIITGAWSILILLTQFRVITLLHPSTMLALGIFVFLMLAFWCWYQYEDWANDIYVVNDDQILDVYKKPLGAEEKRSAPIKSIQSVEFERLGLLGLVLNYGTVYIRIGDTRFHFEMVYNPADVQNELFRRIARKNYNEQKRENEIARNRVLDAVEAYHRVIGDPYQQYEQDEKKRLTTKKP